MKLNNIIKNLSLKDSIKLIGGKDYEVKTASSIEDDISNSISLLSSKKYIKVLEALNKKKVIVLNEKVYSLIDDSHRKKHIYLLSSDPQIVWIDVLKFLYKKPQRAGIEKTAHIGKRVILGKNVYVGHNVVLEDDVEVGDNTKIFHNTVVLKGVKIGSDTLIYSNVTIKERTVIGKRVIIHSGAVIGSDGFGFYRKDGFYLKIPQVGNVVVEDDVEIGANCTIDRAALKSTVLKKGVKLDNLIHIGHNVVVGENTVIAAQTGVAGSSEIGEGCMFGGQVGVADHVKIGKNVILYGKTGVTGNIDDNKIMAGYPMMDYKDWRLLFGRLRRKLFEILGIK